MSIKYNVYYATTANGPWTLANDTPIDHDQNGMEYTISGLARGTKYYLRTIGGVVEDEEFIPYVSQPLGPNAEPAAGVEAPGVNYLVAKAHVVHMSGGTVSGVALLEETLGHEFDISSIV